MKSLCEHYRKVLNIMGTAPDPLEVFTLGSSLKAQLVKNPPAMQETLVQFLDQEDPLEKG